MKKMKKGVCTVTKSETILSGLDLDTLDSSYAIPL